MKELCELIKDLREDQNLLYKIGADYLLRADTGDYSDNTYLENVAAHDVNDVMCDVQKLNSQNHRELARYLQYLKRVEEYEVSRKQSKE